MALIPIALIAGAQSAGPITIPDSGMGYLTAKLSKATAVRIAKDGNRIGVLYDDTGLLGRALYYSYSTNFGRTFTTPTRIMIDKAYSDWAHNFSLTMGAGSTWVAYRRGDKLLLTDTKTSSFSKPRVIAEGVASSRLDDTNIDNRNQWIGYCDRGLVFAYPTADKNVRVGRIEVGSTSGGIIKGGINSGTIKITDPKVAVLPATTPLMQDALGVGTVRVYVDGSTVRILADKQIPRYGVWAVGMSQSNDGARSWLTIPEDSTTLDNHVTYLGYQERGSNIKFKVLATERSTGDYELTIGRAGREWLAVNGDGPTWGVAKWQIVTAGDLSLGLLRGPGVVPTQWYESVESRPQPTPRYGERVIPPLGPSRPSIFESRGIAEVFWNQGSLLADSTGTAWHTSFFPEDLIASYVGVSRAAPWQTYAVRKWTRDVANSRTTSYWAGTFNDIRTWAIGADVVNVAIKNHPTKAGSFQTMFKANVTRPWAPLNPDEDTGTLDWLDEVTNGSNGVLVWLSNDRVCVRRVP